VARAFYFFGANGRAPGLRGTLWHICAEAAGPSKAVSRGKPEPGAHARVA
jgi:hypothetical protein